MKNFPLLIFVLILALHLTNILYWQKAISSKEMSSLPGILAPAAAAAVGAVGRADLTAPDGGRDITAVGLFPADAYLKKWRR